jgi:hypothetical protein
MELVQYNKEQNDEVKVDQTPGETEKNSHAAAFFA